MPDSRGACESSEYESLQREEKESFSRFSLISQHAFIGSRARKKERRFYSLKVLTSLLVTVINVNVRPHLLTLDAWNLIALGCLEQELDPGRVFDSTWIVPHVLGQQLSRMEAYSYPMAAAN